MKNSCSRMPGLTNTNSSEEKGNSISCLAEPWQGALETPVPAKHGEAGRPARRAGPGPGRRLGLGTALERLCSGWQGATVRFFCCSRSPGRVSQLQGPGGAGWAAADEAWRTPSEITPVSCRLFTARLTTLPELRGVSWFLFFKRRYGEEM